VVRLAYEKITFIRLFLFSLFALMFLSSASAEPSASFAMKDLSGKTHRLADYKGKWVVLNYWAKWCPSCVDELPDLSSLYEKHKGKDLVVLGVAVDYKSEKRCVILWMTCCCLTPLFLATPRYLHNLARQKCCQPL